MYGIDIIDKHRMALTETTLDLKKYVGDVKREKDIITLSRQCGSVIEQIQIKVQELRERAIFEKCSTDELKRIRKTINSILRQRAASNDNIQS